MMRKTITIPAPVRRVLDVLHGAGFEAYIVGGCVRDHLMGRTPGDYDVTTAALPTETITAFTKAGADSGRHWQIVETGLQHGTVTVVEKQPDGSHYNVEVTTFRIDGEYLDNRHPNAVTFTRSLAEDLERRDFTVNAMAYSEESGIIDLYDGQGDLCRRSLRCVGKGRGAADKRFREDGLRILRALRFAAVLDFTPATNDGAPLPDHGQIDRNAAGQNGVERESAEGPSTDAAIHILRHLLRGISRERIHVELTKLLCGTAAPRILRAYPDVLTTVLPMLTTEAVCAAADAIEMLPEKSSPELCYAVLFAKCTEDGMRDGVRSLKMSKVEERHIKGLWEHRTLLRQLGRPGANTRYLLRRTVGMYGYDLCREMVYLGYVTGEGNRQARTTNLAALDALAAEGPCTSLSELAVRGQDLMAVGVKGAEIGKTLSWLLDLVLLDMLPNEKTVLLAEVESAQRRK